MKDGYYKAKLVEYRFGKVNFEERSAPYICITFQIIEGEEKWRYVEWKGALTKGAAPWTQASMIACGFDVEKDLNHQPQVRGKEVILNIVTVDSPEAPGVIQTFVRDVLSLT